MYRVHKPEKEAETEGATLRYRGELPMSLDDYSESGRDFWKLVHGKGWNGWRSSRKCKGDAACSGGADAGEMVAQGILDSHLVPVDLPKDVKGVVVGRVVNTGDYDDYATGIPGNQGAYPDEYYFVIEPGTKDKARLRVAIVRFGAKKKPFNHLTIIEAPNGYVRCDPHLDPKPTIGEGDFKSCPRSLPSSDTKGRRKAASSMTSRPSVSSTEALAWLSCTDGCCSASWPPSSMFRRHRRRGDDR